METWALWVQINCAEPRVTFPAFYERVNGYRYPGYTGMDMASLNSRMAETAGEFAVYSVRYAQQCKPEGK